MTSMFIAPRVPMTDPDTGICNPIWYRSFADIFAAFAGGGGAGGVLQPSGGGTGLTHYATGDLIFASSPTTLNRLPDVATGNALISGGVGFAPSWGKIGLTTHVSGTLPIGNGGTGTTSTQFCDLTANVAGTLPVINGGTGATTLTGYLKGNGVLPVTASASIPGTDITGAALTKTDDTNVTLTLGGTPTTALLRAASITVGWTGTLSVPRGGTGAATLTGYLKGNGAAAFTASATIPGSDITGNISGNAANVTGTVAVANGGTGVTASTGTVAVVLSTKPQFANTIGVGAAAAASGSGVSFPAAQSASTDPNTLDDYEEGTWTPVVTAGAGTITAYTAVGVYTKIGRVVHANLDIAITNNGTGSGHIVATLPFANGASITAVGNGRENATTGSQLQSVVATSTANMTILTYNNTYPGGTGNSLVVHITYQV